MKAPVAIGVALFGWVFAGRAAQPIQLHPDHPHYFLWRGKPTVLVTAGEHYGAVMNLDFDYARYLDELKVHRFNLTRVFSGAYREVPGSFHITGNTQAPDQDRFVCPWARSSTAGASDGGNKFDLTQWDESYFRRLEDFVTQAGRRGVVVEFVFFCTMYDETFWSVSPMNARNNVSGIGQVGRNEVYSAKERRLLDVQRAMVRKVVTALNRFDNVYFEVCNEPHERDGVTEEWNNFLIEAVVETEAALPNQHLIAQGFPSPPAAASVNQHVSILNFHYATPESVRRTYALNRVVAFDETGGSDRTDRRYRGQGWEFILAGGGVFDHLDFSFTPEHEDGTAVPLPDGTPGGGGPELRRQLGLLKTFIEGFDFVRMKPDETIIKSRSITVQRAGDSRAPTKATVQALAEAGKAYAIYVNGGTQAELVLELPAGHYRTEWLNTRTGAVEKRETFEHKQDTRTLVSPTYSEDIALRVNRAE
jgi:hypothetical protein